MTKLTTCLWYAGDAEEAAKFYAEHLPDCRVDTVVRAPTDTPSGPKNSVLVVEFTLAGHSFIGLNGGPQFRHSEAVSFQIHTDDQEETDRLWHALTADGGEESMCGWCKDRWGISWQVTPRALTRLIADPTVAGPVMQAMMTMRKIDIAAIEAAAAQARQPARKEHAMPVDENASLEITAFDWVPDFTRGFVRDLRPRWACEEIGLPYAERLISARERPAFYFHEQPWGQVPVVKDGGLHIFESGAILLHLGEKDARLLPHAPQARADAISWLFAAFNSIEPWVFELARAQLFAAGEDWAKAREPKLLAELGGRLDRLVDALGDREWLAGEFSVADIAMATMFRELDRTDLVAARPALADYLARALARPAFARALAAQLAAFKQAA